MLASCEFGIGRESAQRGDRRGAKGIAELAQLVGGAAARGDRLLLIVQHTTVVGDRLMRCFSGERRESPDNGGAVLESQAFVTCLCTQFSQRFTP